MTTDDDKQIPEPDPWAGLDIGGEPAADDGLSDLAAEDIPLVVFPPPDGEAAGSDVRIDAETSGILSMADSMADATDSAARLADAFAGDVEDDVQEDDVQEVVERVGFGLADAGDEAFDDKNIARELGLMDDDGDAIPAASAATGDEFGLDDAAGFGEPVNEARADEVSFDAGMMAEATPFADSEQVEPADAGTDSWHDESASIPLSAAVAATGAAVMTAAGRPAAAKKAGSGLGQMVGVAMGGLMALPITYAILIWGFHKDPFKFGKQVPSQLAFLLPQKLQPGYKPPKKAGAGPSLDAAPSLDDLPSLNETAAELSSETAATAAPSEAEETAVVEPAEPAVPESTVSAAAAETPAAPAAEAVGETVATADPTEASPAMPAASSLAALPSSDALPGLDALVAEAAAAPPAQAALAVAQPPLDLTGVDMAAERAMQAGEALAAMPDMADPARDRMLVVWYKRLARLGEELVRLETLAADSGRPLSPTPTAAADLLDRISVSETAVADLDRLDGMWLTSQSRRADGVTLIAVLGTSRQVGPYWSTPATISGANADGTDRSVAIISRLAPPAEAGDRVVIAGVMFDGDAIWAADMRPVAPEPVATQPESGIEQE